MPTIDFHELMYGADPKKKPYHGANVRFFYAINQNQKKSEEAGRPIFDQIPSISIQFPGGDETVRRVEEKDKVAYPEMWEAFQRGNEPVQDGLPLTEWAVIPGSVVKELEYLGFRTVEQLAAANDDVKRRLGPISNLVKKAQTYLEAANAPQSEIVSLRESLEREKKRTAKLEETLEILLQRINATEGNNLSYKKDVAVNLADEEEIEEQSSKRGRPRKNTE